MAPSIVIGLLFNEAYDNGLIKGPSSTSPQVKNTNMIDIVR